MNNIICLKILFFILTDSDMVFAGFEACDGGLCASLAVGRGFAELSEES